MALLPGQSIPAKPLEVIPRLMVLQQPFLPNIVKLKDLTVLVPYSCRAPVAPIRQFKTGALQGIFSILWLGIYCI